MNEEITKFIKNLPAECIGDGEKAIKEFIKYLLNKIYEQINPKSD